MTLRPAALLTAIALAALTLVGCNPTPVPTSSSVPSETPSPTPIEVVDPLAELPDDAVVGISMRATADTGAAVDILLVLHAPVPYGAPTAVPMANATADWCEGEVDESVFQAEGGFSFAQFDVTATAVDGTPAWPSTLPLHLIPGEGQGPTITAGGGAYPVERPNELNEEGFYVPHCQQDGFLAVPGTGLLYLGWGNDGGSLTGWIGTNYGGTFDSWGEPVNPDQVTLSNCASVITELGISMGGSPNAMSEFFSETQCGLVGSAV